MKSLVDYILESSKSNEGTKTFTWDFDGLEDAKETLEKLVNKAEELDLTHEKEENKFSITVSLEDQDKISDIVDIVTVYYKECEHTSKGASYESYAIRLRKFRTVTKDLKNFFIDEEDKKEQEEAKKNKKEEE